jgi:FAD/FMN-containing dehydrogenase
MTTTQSADFSKVPERMLYGPAAYCARGIENLLIYSEDYQGIMPVVARVAAKAIALTVFPMALAVGLAVEPFFLGRAIVAYYVGYESADKGWDYSLERLSKLFLGLVFSPLALITSDAVSYLFLERTPTDLELRPFGVERVYGKALSSPILYPSSVQEVQDIIKQAKAEGRTISVVGAGMSQGKQTVPATEDGIVLSLKHLKSVDFIKGSEDLIEVQGGAIWEDVMLKANTRGKAVIAKQAGSFFNIAGSIAINCHGWKHDVGAIASTVESLTIINAEGQLITVKKEDELFGCLFGTLGYFGVIVSATFKLEDNEYLQEKSVEVPSEEFHQYYQENIRNNPNKPLLMGRLNIDGNPLQQITINTFDQIHPKMEERKVITPAFDMEAHRGSRIARCFLDAVGHLPKVIYDPLVKVYWNRELEIMKQGRRETRNEIMNFEAKSFFQLGQSDLYTQWLQEYFVTADELVPFLKRLGGILEENDVRLLNASIRPVPKDEVSVLPYAEQDRYAIVISFSQMKTQKEMKKTEAWVKAIQTHLIETGGKWYQPYMPFATREEFEKAYGLETVDNMRRLKQKYDPRNMFSNGHTAKYYDRA